MFSTEVNRSPESSLLTKELISHITFQISSVKKKKKAVSFLIYLPFKNEQTKSFCFFKKSTEKLYQHTGNISQGSKTDNPFEGKQYINMDKNTAGLTH